MRLHDSRWHRCFACGNLRRRIRGHTITIHLHSRQKRVSQASGPTPMSPLQLRGRIQQSRIKHECRCVHRQYPPIKRVAMQGPRSPRCLACRAVESSVRRAAHNRQHRMEGDGRSSHAGRTSQRVAGPGCHVGTLTFHSIGHGNVPRNVRALSSRCGAHRKWARQARRGDGARCEPTGGARHRLAQRARA